jgi:hypothetical protein
MNKFRDLDFIDYNGGIRVHSSLLNVVLHDQPHIECECELLAGPPLSGGRASFSAHPRELTIQRSFGSRLRVVPP